MEPLKITRIELDDRQDFSELHLLINSDEPRPAVSYLVDDDRNFYLRVEPETEKIVGASVLFASDWFREIAEAFENHDLNHPDVRFFFEHKVNEMAARLADEIKTSEDELSTSGAVEPTLDLAHR